MRTLTLYDIAVFYQLPVVGFILLASYLAARHFGSALSRFVFLGWLCNGL
ncbi:MAG: hypothetical protein JWM95_4544, partial [Gemmatimonadetes bacterium]|nr:hypothetical protein [Gemmatimonadota bacterium]